MSFISVCYRFYDICTAKVEVTVRAFFDRIIQSWIPVPQNWTIAERVAFVGQNVRSPRDSVKVPQKYGEINYKCVESGFFADPNNCKRFYKCDSLFGVHYLANIFDCLDDRVYSINQKKCLHQRNSDRPECFVQLLYSQGTITFEIR